MSLEEAKRKARDYIKDLAKGDKELENILLQGMLILEDAINGEI